MTEVRKKLSANDLGETGSHQAGILVPKNAGILSFFPSLDASKKNPRMTLVMTEKDNGERWSFNFIYYNGRLFGGTRNEYRLTCMTRYLRATGARVGDELVFSRDEAGSYFSGVSHAGDAGYDTDVLVLSGGWKVINY